MPTKDLHLEMGPYTSYELQLLRRRRLITIDIVQRSRYSHIKDASFTP